MLHSFIIPLLHTNIVSAEIISNKDIPLRAVINDFFDKAPSAKICAVCRKMIVRVVYFTFRNFASFVGIRIHLLLACEHFSKV